LAGIQIFIHASICPFCLEFCSAFLESNRGGLSRDVLAEEKPFRRFAELPALAGPRFVQISTQSDCIFLPNKSAQLHSRDQLHVMYKSSLWVVSWPDKLSQHQFAFQGLAARMAHRPSGALRDRDSEGLPRAGLRAKTPDSTDSLAVSATAAGLRFATLRRRSSEASPAKEGLSGKTLAEAAEEASGAEAAGAAAASVTTEVIKWPTFKDVLRHF
jgi:hypothetical protein